MPRAPKVLSTDSCNYFCRGCGDPLPRGFHGQFHRDCLKADKRRRTNQKRRLEREKFEAWLADQRCPKCAAAVRLREEPQEGQPLEVAATHSPWNEERTNPDTLEIRH